MGALIFRPVVTLCLAWVFSNPVVAREKPLSSVADLRYGNSLYHYYLDDYLSALSELLVAESKGGIRGHGNNPEIMQGGLALGYQMERYASDIFERLLDENRSAETRDAAWFYLAKLRYEREHWVRALEALERLSKKPNPDLLRDANALKINLFLKQDNIEQAVYLLKRARLPEDELPYFYFNIGSAYARKGEYLQAVNYYNFLRQDIYQKEEYRTLYDKAMTGAGYSFLFLKNYVAAQSAFETVRLSSALSNRALLGYGWAAAEQGNYREALKPWLHLANSALVDENNQEALIAVPYAYEKLGSAGRALAGYQKAEASFAEEIEKINLVLTSLESEELLQALQVQTQEQRNWLDFAAEQQLSPRLTYLVELFSRQQFRGSVQELQDLLAIRDKLQDWQRKIDFYSNMIVTRAGNRFQQNEFFQVEDLRERIANIREQRRELSRKIEDIASDKNYFKLASEDLRPLIERVQRSEKNVEMLRESDPFIDEYEESTRRYRGILLWEASESFGDNLWQLIKVLNQVNESSTRLQEVFDRVNLLTRTAPDLDPYQQRLDGAKQEISSLLVKIEALIHQNKRLLKWQVVSRLEQQRDHLSDYLAQSRLSIARIYDKARQEQEQEQFERSKSAAATKNLDNAVEQNAPQIENEEAL